MLTNLVYILLAVLILGIIIIFHELGHFIVGRMCGIGVVEFAIGFGPKLIGWRRGETDYSIRLLPLGGFCKFVGEDDDNPAPNAMNNAPVWKRILTVFAGPGMNFLLAFVAAVVILCTFPTLTGIYPKVDSLVENMPAQEAQLLPGDVIIAANGTNVDYDTAGTETLRAIIQSSDSVELTVNRAGEALTLTLLPETVTLEDGSAAKQIGIYFTAEYARDSLFEAIPDAGRYLWNTTTEMLNILRNLFFKGEGVEGMAGPIGTVAVVSEQLQQNSSLFLDFLVLISLNLGIMNLLPLPALDGGRLVFLLVEAVRGKPVPPEKEGLVHAVGLLLLLALAVVLTWHDIVTYIL